jgi:hypothetical protein
LDAGLVNNERNVRTATPVELEHVQLVWPVNTVGSPTSAIGGGSKASGAFSSALGATQDSTSVLIRVVIDGGSWLTYVCGN